MKNRVFATIAAILISTTALLVLLSLMGRTSPGISSPALAASLQITPTIALVDPASAPNDLDTLVTITGTDFVSVPAVYLGDTSLSDVEWATSIVLRATVPWGMDPGVYTLTVENPGGESGSLPNALTVTQGIGVWNATEFYGGEVEQVVINPITPTTVYAVSGKAGIFRSRNAGETWSFVYASDARDLAVDPITPTTIYWGTGGLYRSDDEMDTWHWLGEPQNVPYPHPTISQTLYASNSGGSGLWKSTDRGQTWVTTTTGLTDTAVTRLVFHPTDPLTMYLGTANGNIFRSTDAGDSWSFVANPINYILAFSINPRGAHELWVSNHCLDHPNLTLKSTNLEHTAWITAGEPVGTFSLESIDFPPLAWGDAVSETVFAEGCWGTPYRSGNNGDTWQELPLSQEAAQGLALHPIISDTLYGGTKFDGVLKSEDGGQTYRWINQGITALYPRKMATVPGQPDVVYAITDRQGGIHKGTQGGSDWQFLDIAGLDGRNSVVAVDPFTPTHVYVADGWSDGAWVLHVSEDSGQTWASHVISATDAYSDCHHVAPRVLRPDPVNVGHLLAGIVHSGYGTPSFSAGGIYRSTDHGESWTYIDVGEVLSDVNDIAFDALMTATVYAATGSPSFDTGSGMLRSTDSGQSWQTMGEGIAALDRVWSLAVEPRAPHRVFAMTFGDGLYLSEDHGLSWTQAASWLNSEHILCTVEKPPTLYAATSLGLLRSTDGAQSWERAAGTLGYVPIYSLATVTATDRVILYAGTTGGYLQSGGAQVLSLANNDGTLVNAGIHRYTTRRTWDLYLPLVFKAYTP